MKYEEAYIEDLLSRFVKAETTLEEERLLADLFASTPSVPQRWRDFAVLFAGIGSGALSSVIAKHQSADILTLPPSAQSPRRRLKWLKVAGVAAVFCLFCVLGHMLWLKEAPRTNRQEAIATAEKPQLPPADQPAKAPYVAQTAATATALQPQTPKAPSRNVVGQSRRPVYAEAMTQGNDDENKSAKAGITGRGSAEVADENGSQPQLAMNEQQPASSHDNYQTDLSAHIVSAPFAYSQHSQLDERAIRARNRVRAEVLAQYAHIGF